jgi:V/A-type H+-transporting ATPase subunit I
MSISPMKKLTLILPRDDTDTVMRKLMYLRCVDVSKVSEDVPAGLVSYPGEDKVAELTKLLTDIKSAMQSLAKFSQRKKPMFAGRIKINLDDFISSGRYSLALETVNKVNDRISDSILRSSGSAKIHEKITELEPWSAYNLPLNFTGTESTVFMLGSFPASMKSDKFIYDVTWAGGAVDLLMQDEKASYVSVVSHRDDEENVTRALAKLGFTKVIFRDIDKTPLEMITEYKKVFAEETAATAADEAELKKLAENLTDIEILYDAVTTELNAAKAKLRLASTENCTLLSGWVPVKNEEKVVNLLEKYDCAYELSNPAEGDDPPILLENNKFAKNFEWVVGMYSYPKYGSYDPSFIMGIFYCIIFGIMFADVGYGLVLVAACFGGVKLLKPREGMKRFLLMFGYCGISCIVMGALFGGYMSDLPQQIMANLMGIKNPPSFALLLDPLVNPLGFILVSLATGAVHLITGMAIKMCVTWRDGHRLDAVLDTVPWWIFFTGLAMLFLNPPIGKWVAIAGALSLVLTQGRKKKNIIMKFLSGLLSLYGLINYLSDLVSYSRIMALGLASAVLGQVMNILGTMMGNSFIGFIFMILIFIVGHGLNIAINVLGSFVHTSRLQYIEFFSKFYDEGGRAFQPVKPADQYTVDEK